MTIAYFPAQTQNLIKCAASSVSLVQSLWPMANHPNNVHFPSKIPPVCPHAVVIKFIGAKTYFQMSHSI